MENTKLIACWHHGDAKRLKESLDRGFIDVYGKDETTPKGKHRQSEFLTNIRLKHKDRIRIVIGGQIVAYVTIVNGKPFELDEATKAKNGRPWTAGIEVEKDDVRYVRPPQSASCYPNFQKSHRFDTKAALLLDPEEPK